MSEVEKLDRISELAWETRGDWTDPRSNMREICRLVEEIKQAGYLPVEPVQLEVLTPEERAKVWSDYYSGGAVNIEEVDYDEYLCQATIAHNEAKGQLYRVKE